MNPDYHEQCGPEFTSREHQLFATLLANFKLDEELGFLCKAGELETLYRLAIAMGTHSPHGQRWEYLGLRVFNLIEAQRAGEVTSELVARVWAARAEVAALGGDGLPAAPVDPLIVSDDEVSEGDDVPSVEGGYLWHTDGRAPEPLN